MDHKFRGGGGFRPSGLVPISLLDPAIASPKIVFIIPLMLPLNDVTLVRKKNKENSHVATLLSFNYFSNLFHFANLFHSFSTTKFLNTNVTTL